jgi:hypothetical protein
MHIYISGKITGLPEKVYKENFRLAEQALEILKFKPVNPVNLPDDHDKSWKSYMSVDLKVLKECDAIFMMDCWQDSRGAIIEHWFAKRYNKIIIYQPKY